MEQRAERDSLTQYRVYGPAGDVQSEINLQRQLFTAHDAPLTPAIEGLGLADSPSVMVQGLPYRLCKTLRSNNFFANQFDLGLLGPEPNAAPAITASYGNRGWSSLVWHEGQEFLLTPKSWFGFRFELTQRNAAVAARLRDVSPFLSMSSRRRYRIDCPAGPQAPLLLAFTFLLAVSSTYRLAI